MILCYLSTAENQVEFTHHKMYDIDDNFCKPSKLSKEEDDAHNFIAMPREILSDNSDQEENDEVGSLKNHG